MVVSVLWDGGARNKKGLSDPGEALRTFAAVLDQRAQAPNAPQLGVFVLLVRFIIDSMAVRIRCLAILCNRPPDAVSRHL